MKTNIRKKTGNKRRNELDNENHGRNKEESKEMCLMMRTTKGHGREQRNELSNKHHSLEGQEGKPRNDNYGRDKE